MVSRYATIILVWEHCVSWLFGSSPFSAALLYKPSMVEKEENYVLEYKNARAARSGGDVRSIFIGKR